MEAVETAIWFTEVAPHTASGKKLLGNLKAVNREANPSIERLALKLATGAGKTTVMAMLIAWQTLNAVRRPGSKHYTRGFAMKTITPLLELQPGEVLINLMTKDIRRFIESPEQQTQASFNKLFGRSGVRERVEGAKGLHRDDVVVEEYCRSVRESGRYRYVCSAIVLHPERDRTHFHLIYATRHRKGVEVFKDAEKKAMATQESARATARERRRVETTGMASLFEGPEMHSPAYYEQIRQHYVDRSRSVVSEILRQRGRVSYDEIWDAVMAQPLTWESDLKQWLAEWANAGHVSHAGWQPRQRVPRLDEGNVVVWS